MPVSGIHRVGMERLGTLQRMSMHVGNFARGVALGLKFGAPAATIGAAAIFAQGCDTAKIDCESQPVSQVNDGLFGQITQRLSEGKLTYEVRINVRFSGLEAADNARIAMVIGTENARIGGGPTGELEFRRLLEQEAFAACGATVTDCSPFTGEKYDGALFPVGIQKTFEGSRLYEDIKTDSETPGMWAGIGPVVDRIWGHQVFQASDLFTVYEHKIDMTSGEPVEKAVYLETDREGFVLDAGGNRLLTAEEALANGRDISTLVDPSIQAGHENAGMDPQAPDALGLEQNTGYFRFNRAEDKWNDLDENGYPVPDFSLGGSGHIWEPVMDPSKTLQDIYEAMAEEGVDATVYAIPLKVKARIRDLREGSELEEMEVGVGEMALEDFLRNPISFELPTEYVGSDAVNAEITFTAEADPTSFETAFVYTAFMRAMAKLDIPGTCEAPADGGSE